MHTASGLAWLGRSTRNFLADAGGLWRLGSSATVQLLVAPWRGGVRLRQTLEQSLLAGYNSLGLVSLICLLVGMITALQSAYQLATLGAENLVASLVAISVTRELAPLLTAVIVTGRYGSAIAAELGTMRVSQEIDALEVMGIDPLGYLVVPRLLALILMLPCLVLFADLVGIAGGFVVSVGVLELGAGSYISDTLDALVLQDIFTGLVKAVAFAIIIGVVGCYEGLGTRGGAGEVGRSTTSAVVRSIVLIVAADLLVTAWFYLGG